MFIKIAGLAVCVESKSEATETMDIIQMSPGTDTSSTLPHILKVKRSHDSGNNNPKRMWTVEQLNHLTQAQPGYKRFDKGCSHSLSNSYIVEQWTFVVDFLAEFNGKKCQKMVRPSIHLCKGKTD